MNAVPRLLTSPVTSVEEYLQGGGGEALEKTLSLPRTEIVWAVKESGLRGRGGAGFPTGVKWAGILEADRPRYMVCNGAEGEPATYKDRLLIRTNPYQLLEGVAIAAHVAEAEAAYVAIKASFEREAELLADAIEEMRQNGLLGHIPVYLVLGPDEYLYGEEKAMMEVIEGKDPMPRIMAPYMHGLFGEPYRPNPTLVNNVESLYNVPLIIRHGPQWFRSAGTDGSPGTMVFTLLGDVQRPGMYELPLGTPLSTLLYDIGGGPFEGREFKALLSGCSHAVVTPSYFDTPLDFDALSEVGSGLGAAGFTVYDDTACMVRVAAMYARFLYVESCAQCNPCKLHSGRIVELLESIDAGKAHESDIAAIMDSAGKVTDGQRCYLPSATSVVVQSIMRTFVGEFAAHLEHSCPNPRELLLPKVKDFDPETSAFTYDTRYALKQPDWTYADEPGV